MFQKDYDKNETHAFQTLTIAIQAGKKTVFQHLATTEGISQWFPQLSLTKKEDEAFVEFDMGDGTFEKMSLLDYTTDQHIAFEWASGKVEFHLEDIQEGTKLTLKETLPLDFKALPQDFTGWYVQLKNIKAIVETDRQAKINPDEINEVRAHVEEAIR